MDKICQYCYWARKRSNYDIVLYRNLHCLFECMAEEKTTYRNSHETCEKFREKTYNN